MKNVNLTTLYIFQSFIVERSNQLMTYDSIVANASSITEQATLVEDVSKMQIQWLAVSDALDKRDNLLGAAVAAWHSYIESKNRLDDALQMCSKEIEDDPAFNVIEVNKLQRQLDIYQVN